MLFDSTNLLSNIFPRGIAVGERLWSDKMVRDEKSAATRILKTALQNGATQHTCGSCRDGRSLCVSFKFEYSGP